MACSALLWSSLQPGPQMGVHTDRARGPIWLDSLQRQRQRQQVGGLLFLHDQGTLWWRARSWRL